MMQRHGKCGSPSVKTYDLRMADWARVEQRHKIWAARRVRFFANVRGVFILLLVAAIVVFIFNHRVEVQSAASAGLHQLTKKHATPDKFREQALRHEKEVDQITQ